MSASIGAGKGSCARSQLKSFRHPDNACCIDWGIRHLDCDAPHPLVPLRSCQERPRGSSAAEEGNELAPSHSITSICSSTAINDHKMLPSNQSGNARGLGGPKYRMTRHLWATSPDSSGRRERRFKAIGAGQSSEEHGGVPPRCRQPRRTDRASCPHASTPRKARPATKIQSDRIRTHEP